MSITTPDCVSGSIEGGSDTVEVAPSASAGGCDTVEVAPSASEDSSLGTSDTSASADAGARVSASAGARFSASAGACPAAVFWEFSLFDMRSICACDGAASACHCARRESSGAVLECDRQFCTRVYTPFDWAYRWLKLCGIGRRFSPRPGKMTGLFGVNDPRFVYALSVRSRNQRALFVREVLHRSCNPRLPPSRAHTSARRSERAHARGRTSTRDTAPRLHVEARTALTPGRVSSRLGSSRKSRARLARGRPRDKVTGA